MKTFGIASLVGSVVWLTQLVAAAAVGGAEAGAHDGAPHLEVR